MHAFPHWKHNPSLNLFAVKIVTELEKIRFAMAKVFIWLKRIQMEYDEICKEANKYIVYNLSHWIKRWSATFLVIAMLSNKKKKKEKSVLPETNSALEDTSTGLCNTGRQDPECKTATPTCDILATASQRGLNTELSPVFILNSVQLNMNPWGVYFFFLPLYQKNVRHTGKVWQLFHTQSCLIPLMYKH